MFDIYDLYILRDNYMQVDVFYRELNFEHIEQHPLFSYPSLLSEVLYIYIYILVFNA